MIYIEISIYLLTAIALLVNMAGMAQFELYERAGMRSKKQVFEQDIKRVISNLRRSADSFDSEQQATSIQIAAFANALDFEEHERLEIRDEESVRSPSSNFFVVLIKDLASGNIAQRMSAIHTIAICFSTAGFLLF